MDETLKRKLNILIFLAKVDGKFHKAERALLDEFVRENNLDESEFKSLLAHPEQLDAENIIDKVGMMYLALKVINADGHLDELEIKYCHELAEKLGFKPELVDQFASKNLSKEEFAMEANAYKI